ncbi:hypothetical protein H311_03710 [Anncaliia algerae PRA109]|nr:hypothetical protein H311_03710 [Anncaliia algerae PRA109]
MPDTQRETIWPIIFRHIRVGSIITSDGAAIYKGLDKQGYTHLTVNHSTNFVNPINGATTNHVESAWQKLKTGNKLRFGTHRSTLALHLAEYSWKREFHHDLRFFFQLVKDYYS